MVTKKGPLRYLCSGEMLNSCTNPVHVQICAASEQDSIRRESWWRKGSKVQRESWWRLTCAHAYSFLYKGRLQYLYPSSISNRCQCALSSFRKRSNQKHCATAKFEWRCPSILAQTSEAARLSAENPVLPPSLQVAYHRAIIGNIIKQMWHRLLNNLKYSKWLSLELSCS